MICLMHDGEPYGHLTVNGRALSAKQLSAVLGDSERDITKWLGELEENSVLSRTEDGVIFCRRMIRDREREDRDKENGKSGGNPRLKGPDNRGVNPQDKGGDKAHIPDARDQTLESNSLREKIPEGAAEALKPRFDTVRGGAKRFAGLGERPFKPKDQQRADKDMERHLTTMLGMDLWHAQALIIAARDPDNPDHIDAARTCERESRQHRLGWFHMEAAE